MALTNNDRITRKGFAGGWPASPLALGSGFKQFVPVFFARRIVEPQIHFYGLIAALPSAGKFDKLK